MKVRFVVIGKTSAAYLKEGIDEYAHRLKRYCDLEIDVVSDVRKGTFTPERLREAEAELLLKRVRETDFLVLLDEKGKEFSSVGFASELSKWQMSGSKVVFMIGGAYGFSDQVYERSNIQLSLSKMTFSHQMVRVIFLEQLYRAFTIIKKEPYHHA